MNKISRNRGATTGLVAVCAFVLVMLVTAFVQLTLYIGGGREMRNAIDAGALNVAKKACTDKNLKTTLSPGVQSQFEDVLDKHHEVGLGNINAIWGKALLAEANAQAMAADGQSGAAKSHADELFDAARKISDQLAAKLNDEQNLYPIFEEISSQNSMRMLGANTQAKALQNAASWQASLTDREKESNLEVTTPSIMPGNTHALLPLSKGFIQGYTPITIGGRTFCFVPFAEKERPHLISRTQFEADTAAAKPLNGPEWGTPVPNAFSCRGQTQNQTGAYGQEGMAWVVANPQTTFKLSMSHSFVHIKLEKPQAEWYWPLVGGVVPIEESYDATTGSKSYPTMPAGWGTVSTTATLGLDLVASPTLDLRIFELPSPDLVKVETALVNRINQMISKPGKKFTTSDLHVLLNDPAAAAEMMTGTQDFYIYSPDGEHVLVQSKSVAQATAAVTAPWLLQMIDHDPDGTENTLSEVPGAGIPGVPPIVVVAPWPYGATVAQLGLMWHGNDIYWQPGSGYDGCLGQLRVQRTTEIKTFGLAL